MRNLLLLLACLVLIADAFLSNKIRSQRPFCHPLHSSPSSAEIEARSTVLTKGQQNRARGKPFITGELRPFAMKLHTRKQAPKEGGTIDRAEKPVAAWNPTREGYLQFLVDSREVYRTLEELTASREELAMLQNTGLERVGALNEDIAYLASHPSLGDRLEIPDVGELGKAYANHLRHMSHDLPSFLNHFYNFYFAHTAGGRMIGAKLSELLLDGKTLKFYQWDGDVKELLARTAGEIDSIAAAWSREEKDKCLEETGPAFKFGGSLLTYIK